MITTYPPLYRDYLLDVARGSVSGAKQISAYGRRTTAGAETNVLWPDGTYAFPADAGVQMSIVSASANDVAAGTGIRTVKILYLDANLAEQSETVTLNGTTPVLTVATNIRFIQCMYGLTFGSGKLAAGTISASNGGSTYSEISAGFKRCSSSVRMVPAGKRLIVVSYSAGSESGTSAETIINLATPSFDGNSFISSAIFFTLLPIVCQDDTNSGLIPCPFIFTAGQAVGMTFTTDKAAIIVGSWTGFLENV